MLAVPSEEENLDMFFNVPAVAKLADGESIGRTAEEFVREGRVARPQVTGGVHFLLYTVSTINPKCSSVESCVPTLLCCCCRWCFHFFCSAGAVTVLRELYFLCAWCLVGEVEHRSFPLSPRRQNKNDDLT